MAELSRPDPDPPTASVPPPAGRSHDTLDPRVVEVLTRWRTARREGRQFSAEDLCHDCPDVLDAVRHEIETESPAAPPGEPTAALPAPASTWATQGPEGAEGALTRSFDGGPSDLPFDGPPPAHVPGYEVLGVLGRGGMGVVYKARHLGLKRVVALKMILAASHAGPDQVKRFQPEAEAVARLQHPNIVQIYEIGDTDGTPYFSLEYCEGGSLSERVRKKLLPPREAAAVVETLARAMQYAHERGVIHRDLKPANVLLTADGTPKVTDFGLAKSSGEQSGQTHSGAVLGTPSYMAPEQAAGKAKSVGPAADVYSLGAVLYDLLTGRPPFRAASVLETISQVVGSEPVSPTRLAPGLDRDLETICLRCLEKDPARRYASALALAEDLRRYQAGEPVLARPAGRWEKLVKWARRRPAVAALAGLSLLLAVLGFAGVTWQWREAVANAHAEQRQRGIAEDALARAQTNLYYQRLGRAQYEWQTNHQVEQADRLLEDCPPELRQWEWHYLKRVCHGVVSLRGHRRRLTAVAYSRDGKRLASADAGGAVKVWDAAAGRLLGEWQGDAGPVRALAFLPDGRLAAACGKTVKIWKGLPGREATLTGHTGQVVGVAAAADGKWLATASEDGTARLWDGAGKPVATLTAHKGRVNAVAFSPDSGRLATAGQDRAVHLWEVAALAAGKAAPARTLPAHADAALGVAFSDDGKRLAVPAADPIRDSRGEVRVWDLTTGAMVHRLRGHMRAVTAAAFRPGGTEVATAGNGGLVRVWDAATGAELRTYRGHTRPVAGLAFSPDGERLATAGDDAVKLWDATAEQEARVLRGHERGATAVTFGAGGELFSAGADGTVAVWDSATGAERARLPGKGGAVAALARSPDGKRLAAGGGGGLVRTWDAAGRAPLLTLPGDADVFAVAYSPDGRLLASADMGGAIRIRDAETGKEVHVLRGHTGPVGGLAFAPDGSTLASAGQDRTMRLWDVATGKERQVLQGHTTPLAGVAYSPDGRRLASVGGSLGEGEVKVWDAATGEDVRALAGHTGRVMSAAFTRDGRRLVTGARDHTVKVWDVATGEPVLTLRGHTGAVFGVALSDDDRRIASASLDGTVRVWDSGPRQ